MIKSIELQEFRGVKKTTKPIMLKKVNLIVGRNNSAKTTLLQALAFLQGPYNSVPLIGHRTIDYLSIPHGSRRDSFVYGYAGEANLKFEIDYKTPSLKISAYGSAEPGDFPSELRRQMCYYSGKLHEVISLSIVQEPNWRQILKTKAHMTIVKEVINPTITEEFTELIILLGVLNVRREFPDGTSTYIRLTELGEGVQRAIIPLLWFEAAKPDLVLWDDLEASMHPSLLESVLKWLFSKDWQVVISTHSLDVIAAFAELNPPESQLITLRKNSEDVLDHETLNPDELQTLIESNIDPRKLADLLALR